MASPKSPFFVLKTPTSSKESPNYYKKILAVTDSKLKRYRQLYEDEVSDKNDLLQEHFALKKEVEGLKKELKEKACRIKQLNEDLLIVDSKKNEESEDLEKKIKNCLERKFKSDINSLEAYCKQISEERAELEEQNEKNEKRINSLTKEIQIKSLECYDLEGIKKALTETVDEQTNEINYFKNYCNELQELVNQLRPLKKLDVEDSSFSGVFPEATESLSAVVELQLQEKTDENEKLLKELSCKEVAINELELSLFEKSRKLSEKEIELHKTIEALELHKSLLKDSEETNSCLLQNLEQERARFNESLEMLKGQVQEYVVSLENNAKKISEMENKNLELENILSQTRTNSEEMKKKYDIETVALKDKVMELEMDLNNANDLIMILNENLGEATVNISELEKKKLELEDLNHGLSQEMKMERARLNESLEMLKGQVQEYVVSLENNANKIFEMENRNLELENTLSQTCSNSEEMIKKYEIETVALKDKVKELEIALKTANDQITVLNENFDEATVNISELEKKKLELEDLNHGLSQEIEMERARLNESLELLRGQVQEYVVSLENNAKKISEMENKNRELENTLSQTRSNSEEMIKKYEIEKVALRDKVIELEMALNNANDQIMVFKENFDAATVKISELEKKKLELEDLNYGLTQEMEMEHARLNELLEMLKGQVQEYVVSLENKAKKISEMENKNLELENTLSQTRSNSEEMIKKYEIETVALKDEMKGLSKSLNSANDEYLVYCKKFEKATVKISELEKKNLELEDLNHGLSQEIEMERARLNESLELLRGQVQEYVVSLENNAKKISEMENKNRELENTLSQTRSNSEEMIKKYEIEKVALRDKVIELEMALNNANDQIMVFKENFDAATVKISELEKKKLELEDLNHGLSQEIEMERARLNESLELLRGQVQEYVVSLENNAKKISEMENKNRELENTLSQTRSNSEEMIKKYEIEKVALRDKVIELEMALNNANDQIMVFKENFDAATVKISELEKKKLELEDLNYGLTQEMEMERARLNESLEMLKGQVQEYVVSLENNAKKISEMENKNLELESILSQTRSNSEEMIKKYEIETVALKDKMKELEVALNNANDQIMVLNENFDEALVKISELEKKKLELEDLNLVLSQEIEMERARLNESLEMLKGQVQEYVVSLENNAKKISEMENKNLELESILSQTRSNSEEMIKKYEIETVALKDKMKELEVALNNANDQIMVLNENFDEALVKISELEKKKLELEDLNLVLSQEIEMERARLNESLEMLKGQVQEYVVSLENNAKKISEMENKNLELESILSQTRTNSEEMIKKYEIETVALKDKMKELEVALNNANDQIMVLNENFDEALVKISELEKKKLELEDLNHGLSHEIEMERARLNESLEMLKGQVQEYTVSLENNEKKISEMENKNLELENTLSQTRSNSEEIMKKYEIETVAMKDKVIELEIALNTANDQITVLNENLDGASVKISELERKKLELENLNHGLSQEMEMQKMELEKANAALSEQIDNYHDSLSNKSKELSIKNEEELQLKSTLELLKNSLEATVKEKETKITNLEEKLSLLESNLNCSKEANSSLELKLSEESQKVSKLEEEWKELKDANSLLSLSLEQKKSDREESHKTLLKQMDDYRDLLSAKSAELTEKTNEVLQLENNLSLVKCSLEEAVEKNKEVVTQLEEKLSDLERSLNGSSEQNAELQLKLEKESQKVGELEKELEELKNANDRLQLDLEKKKSDREESHKTLLKQMDDYRDLLSAKSAELTEKTNEVLQLENNLSLVKCSLEEAVEKSKEVVTQLKEKLSDLERSLNGSSEQNDELQLKLEKESQKVGELEKELEELKNANDRLQLDLEKMQTEMMLKNETLRKQMEEYRDASQKYKSKWEERMKQVKEDYEGQLAKIKQFMTNHYHSKMEKQEKEAEEKLKMYKEKITKDQDHIKDLHSQIWNLSEKLLQVQQEVKLMTSNRRATISRLDLATNPDGQMLRSMSVDHLRGGWEKEHEKLICKNDSEDLVEEVAHIRRKKLVPSGIGKVFPSEEDEDGEFFDAACLADLKEGRVRLSPQRDLSRASSRLSILQQRNSLCPPHLKSSYPAETQFLHPAQIHEEEIKLGAGNDSDTGSLLSKADRKKKDAGQTLYKKPGPPTPSKHGNRLSQSGNQLPRTPSENKENESIRSKHSSTPSKIMDYIRNKMRRDERPNPVAFTISPVPSSTTSRIRGSGFFRKKGERL